MKKVFLALIFILTFSLCACDKKEASEVDIEQEKKTVTYSGDDLALFYNTENNILVNTINLYMNKNDIDFENSVINNIMNSCTVGYREIDGESYINYIYFNGNPEPVFTAKDIKTTGIDFLDEEKCSDENDILSAYEINPEEEEVYFKPSENTSSKMLALYFKVDKDGNVERIKYPKGTDISDFEALEANAYLYYEINNSKVIGLVLKSK